MTRILVTGADGYVGSHVIAALKSRPVEIHVVARNSAAADAARGLGLVPHTIALEQADALRSLARSVDGIAHLAASDNPAFLPVNRAAIEAMVAGLPAGAAFVMHGGSLVFGDTGKSGLAGEPKMNPPPPLAGRAQLDRFVLDSAVSGVRTHIVYGGFVFGGHGAMIPNTLVKAAKTAGYSAFIGDGAALWSAVHILDWADLIVSVLLDGKTSGVPVFAAAQQISMRDAADLVANAFRPTLPAHSVTLEAGQELWGFFAPSFTMSQYFDGEKARTDYGWNPEPRDMASEFRSLADQLTK